MHERLTILMADDSENDRILMRAAFKMAKCNIDLHEAGTGEDALAYLKGDGPYANRTQFPLPTVLLLDLNMPKVDGYGVLTWARTQPELKHLAIVILTASVRIEDVERSFDLGAISFLVKPSRLETLSTMMRCLCDWMQMNQFMGRYQELARP